MSPWFAAGAGFVIATAAFIVAPRGVLEFPNNAIQVTPCRPTLCQTTTRQGLASLPLTEPGEQIPLARPGTALGPTLGYSVLWRHWGSFSMEITVPGKYAIGSWRLEFVIPGSHITNVLGARWQPSGHDGITVYGPTTVTGGYSPDGQTGYSGSQFGSDPSSVWLIVNGDGTASPPAGCNFDGAQCQFTGAS